MISDHNGITLEMSNKKFTEKSPNIWKLKKNHTSKQSMSQRRSLKGNKKFIELSEIKNRAYQIYGAQTVQC